VSSVPPDRHAGNLDLRHQNEGTKLFIPVWRPGALIFTGDSHVLQGDGEVNLTAIESAMNEVRVTVTLHKGALAGVPESQRWPIAETATEWIIIATNPDLNAAFRQCLLNVLRFLQTRVGLTALDAYSLASIAASFRITQVVDVKRGVHAMIPKSIFSKEKLRRISVV
jgi:acetamidase/formamidase